MSRDNGVDTIAIARCGWVPVTHPERYLQEDEKRRTLDHYRSMCERIEQPPTGATGVAEPAIRPLLERLNAIPGICTVQSCSGHPANDFHGELAGQVWLRLSREMTVAFRRDVGELARKRNIYQVATLYLDCLDPEEPMEVVWICFESWSGIGRFFEDLYLFPDGETLTSGPLL